MLRVAEFVSVEPTGWVEHRVARFVVIRVRSPGVWDGRMPDAAGLRFNLAPATRTTVEIFRVLARKV